MSRCLALAGALALSGSCLAQPDKSALARVARYCNPEVDDPASAEYSECTAGLRELERSLRETREDIPSLLLLSRSHFFRGSSRGSEFAARILRFEPQNVEAIRLIALNSSSPRERLDYLQRLTQLDGDDPQVHGLLALELLAAAGPVDRIAQETAAQIRINPGSAAIPAVISGLLARNRATAIPILKDFLSSSIPEAQRCRPDFLSMLRQTPELREPIEANCAHTAAVDLALTDPNRVRGTNSLTRLLADQPDHPMANLELAIREVEAGRLLPAGELIQRQLRVDRGFLFANLPRLLSALDKAAATDLAATVARGIGSFQPSNAQCAQLFRMAASLPSIRPAWDKALAAYCQR